MASPGELALCQSYQIKSNTTLIAVDKIDKPQPSYNLLNVIK